MEGRSRRSTGRTHRLLRGRSAYHRRGTAGCNNALTVPMENADTAVLQSLKSNLLNPRGTRGGRGACRRPAQQAEIVIPDLTREPVYRWTRRSPVLTYVIAAGGNPPTLAAAIQQSREARLRCSSSRYAPRHTARRRSIRHDSSTSDPQSGGPRLRARLSLRATVALMASCSGWRRSKFNPVIARVQRQGGRRRRAAGALDRTGARAVMKDGERGNWGALKTSLPFSLRKMTSRGYW